VASQRETETMKLAQYKVIAKDVNADLTAALANHG
jgi:hypothetical protein